MSQYVILSFVLMLLYIHIPTAPKHTLRLVEPPVNKRDVIICHIKFLLQTTTSVAWAVAMDVTAYVPISQIITWAYLSGPSDRLPLDDNQSLRGYYLYTGVFCE